MTRREQAMSYFKEGYNCAQSVVIAFSDMTGLDKETSAKYSSSFGGGMGRLREICGAVSGMFMVLSVVEGYSSPTANTEKMEQYAKLQSLAEEFKKKNGSYICRDLLEDTTSTTPKPEMRTAEYYQKRPCEELVGDATEMLEKFFIKEGIIK